MRSLRSITIALILVIAAIVLLGASWALIAKNSHPRNADETWYFGPPSARWLITEYADLECPYCKAYTPQLKQWVSKQENVKLAWHHFPLDSHGRAALLKARIVQCAGYLGGATVFWQAIDQVLLQPQGNEQGLTAELQLPDVSSEALSNCTRTRLDIAAAVDRQRAEAKSRGIAGTPTLEVTDSLTGHSVRLEGPVDSAALLSVIDALAAQPAQEKAESSR
ncbi:DsbA family protein [Pseudomonas asiatica]|uniref:Thioredoxin domain-containing protein n=1 Tax=Pseudomonas asiatica TaxID=2219225 RepID=A0ABU5KVU9_9PSED|nr:thioredoxin domain-containing protein [Pseudomonas asiatica]MDZ5738041.1 thioredoxin domain-containing protein [Pseudomonas asiatica]MDZ5744637.1 thioredoxin domain-containing protein [Pseudomonas asiatica]MDZ5748797.1 thioredoxin domain-containing protein [Pseudomonas asiatica]MDZ5753129.1 thioredoxin domain-containing protein [Pseudomonas asiatica]